MDKLKNYFWLVFVGVKHELCLDMLILIHQATIKG